ncbi:hypothetical protein [Kitasatospora sp. GP82]|uniref:hypothetical protein n=1 Tax=Kitasatospora sp. GP82 TaxID=3035089 RepID=UPI0024742292|nr:hypothetical protein [Kitasatospora sp. GP82]MDH6125179.1 hypothetical protein [Kitasatospora sp. GP82]
MSVIGEYLLVDAGTGSRPAPAATGYNACSSVLVPGAHSTPGVLSARPKTAV